MHNLLKHNTLENCIYFAANMYENDSATEYEKKMYKYIQDFLKEYNRKYTHDQYWILEKSYLYSANQTMYIYKHPLSIKKLYTLYTVDDDGNIINIQQNMEANLTAPLESPEVVKEDYLNITNKLQDESPEILENLEYAHEDVNLNDLVIDDKEQTIEECKESKDGFIDGMWFVNEYKDSL